MIETKRPKCACGNTQNPDGYCDGSHAKKIFIVRGLGLLQFILYLI